jgi:phospholipid-binding lipoprotein MlaA
LARWLVFAAFGLIITGSGTFSGAVHADSAPTSPSIAEAQPFAAELQALAADSQPLAAPQPPAVEPRPLASETAEPSAATVTPAADAPAATEPAVAAEGADSVVAEAGVEALQAAEPDSTPAVAEREEDTWMAQARDPDAVEDVYDPWEPFNERMFEVNRRLDRYILKPVAKAYNFITPDELQIMISNGFDNISFPPRFVNSLLQGKFAGATREIGRFLINSTIGVGGLFDPAKDVFGLVKSREDFGQTLGFYGVGPGPFLIVPLMEPMNVRDGVGKFVDGAMDPLAYYLPFLWDRLGMKAGDIINERSLNLDLFQGFEESVIDLYSAVRHGYSQRREKLIRE